MGSVLTYKTPCKPKPKDLFVLCVYTYLYITSYHIIFTDHFKDLKGLWCRFIMNQTSSQGQGDLFSSNQMSSNTKVYYFESNARTTRHGELNSRRRTLNDAKFFNQNCQFQLLTFLVYPARSLKTLHTYIIHIIA